MSTDDRVHKVFPKKEQILAVKRNVSCSVEGCTKTFLHEGMLKMHLVKSHGIINNENDRRLSSKTHKKASDIKYMFFCPEQDCKYTPGGKHFSSFHLLKQHFMKMHADKKYFCQKCEKGFSEQRFLRQHEDQCGKLYTCGSCPVFYTTREALMTHCKRQRHTYPEEYKRKDEEKEEKRRPKNNKETCATIGTTFSTKIPVLLLAVEKVVTTPAQNLPPLLPKPSKIIKQCPSLSLNTTEQNHTMTCNTVREQNEKIGFIKSKQEMMTQTDIYGIRNLSVSETNPEKLANSECHDLINTNFHISERNGTESQITSAHFRSNYSPKGKQKVFKRRCSYPRPASPRRKKIKTTTGIQTSVSLTQKRRAQNVSSTQTTGDLILRRAMEEANIPIQKRNVGSQVTPNKYRIDLTNSKYGTAVEARNSYVRKPLFKDSFSQVDQFEKPLLVDSYSQISIEERPLLVDSFCQVRQGNIIAETSDMLAERQTMTDRPESISTQTCQSFLVDKQNQNLQNDKNDYAINSTVRSGITSTSKGVVEDRMKGSTVEIYNDRLDRSIKIHVPIENEPKQRLKWDPRKAYLQKIRNQNYSSNLYTSNIDENASENYNFNGGNSTEQNTTAVDNNQPILTQPAFGRTTKVSSNTSTSTTIDNEAQAMSAEEFIQLLQSSGVYLGTPSDKHSGLRENSMEIPSEASTVNSGNVFVSTNQNLDFDKQTIDTNTQTASDFDLLESIGAIDMNTQTTGNGIDFLDLVMNNMETQTLNDNDLESLSLANLSSSDTLHTLGVGTNDLYMNSKATSPRAGFDDTNDYQISLGFDTQSLGIGTSDFEMESNLTAHDLLLGTSYTQTCSTLIGTSTQTGFTSGDQMDGKVKVQSETQTIGCEARIQLVQTETQTQKDYSDFDVTNMETQTTFDEFCDWLI